MKHTSILRSAWPARTAASPAERASRLEPQFAPIPPKRARVEVVIPVYNEAETLERQIARLDKYLHDKLPYAYLITIADNGSADATWKIATGLCERLPNIRAKHLDQKGRGRALKEIWLASDADILAYMDVDLSTDLDGFLPMIRPLLNGDAAIGIGSRLARGAQVKRSFKREAISRIYNKIIKFALHTKFSDAQCGFKAIRADAAREILPEITDNEWFFDTELLAKAERRGWTVNEVPVAWVEDPDSRVNINKTASDDLKGLSRLRQEFGRGPLAETPVLSAILLASLLLYTVGLTKSGYANSFYAAAVQAATTSWKALFFGSLDGASFITVDKPPVSIWLMALSGRILGFSSFSMLLPDALAGVATVWLVYATVRRVAGSWSALIAAATMLLIPVATLMFRFNNPDAILTMFLAASGYAFIRAMEDRRPVLWLVWTGIFTGFAFNTKMLQGLIVLPILGLTYLIFARPKFLTRLWQLGIGAVAAAVSSLWWPTIVSLIPKADRPYVGSSTNDSIWNLIFGYNGVGRLLGTGTGQGGAGGAMRFSGELPGFGGTMPSGAGFAGGTGGGMGTGSSGFGQTTGWLRMFNSDFGPNIAWLIPAALIGTLVALWLLRRRGRSDLERVGVIVFAGWLLIHMVVFSITSGVIHPYYPVVMAPAVAALIGITLPHLWREFKERGSLGWTLAVAVAATSTLALSLLGDGDNWPWLGWSILVVGTVGALGMLAYHYSGGQRLRNAMAAVSLVACVAGPAAFSVSTAAAAHTGSIPTSGPSATAVSVTNNESSSADSALVKYLLANRDGATWIVAVASANESAPIQLTSGQPVMAVGGFNGSDDALSTAELAALVREGKLRYYAVTGTQGGGMGGNSQVLAWVQAHGTVVDYGGTGTTLYKLNA